MARHRRFVIALAATVIAAVSLALPTRLPPAAQDRTAVSAPPDFSALAKPLLPAVVNISSSILAPGPSVAMPGNLPPQLEEFFRHFFGPEGMVPDAERPRGTALGSGFIIDPAGFVVTNNHVVENAETISVVLHDESEYQAELVGRDPRTDLALLKIDAGRTLPFVRWGDSGLVEVGQWVLAVGNPFGLGGSVTAGIVSALARSIGAGPYDDFLQTDASINQGNSGGPMFNMRGEVIGINTAIFSPTGVNIGIGFAIPSSLARPVIDQLRTTGEVRRGWLGVTVQPVTPEIAETLGLDKPEGVLVAEVTRGGPAARAGIQVGDVLLSYEGAPIGERNRLPLLVARSEIGSTVAIQVWRDGKQQPIKVRIGNLSEAPAPRAQR
ncbi:MAG: Do family serine endopeptidase [Rhodospirillales bacterium]|nr:Do family serine endopeptidase [Rhodospirillales bacterium]